MAAWRNTGARVSIDYGGITVALSTTDSMFLANLGWILLAASIAKGQAIQQRQQVYTWPREQLDHLQDRLKLLPDVTSRARGSGRQREYCSTSCRRHYIYSLRTKPSKRLTCKNCGTPIRQPTGRGRPRLWCSIRCRDRDQYRRYRDSRLARSKAWREAFPERVEASRKAWAEANGGKARKALVLA
jgi:hypothetical protein